MFPLGRYATIVALFMALEMALWTCAESLVRPTIKHPSDGPLWGTHGSLEVGNPAQPILKRRVQRRA